MSITKLTLFFISIQFSLACRTTSENNQTEQVLEKRPQAFTLANRYARDGLYSEAIEQYRKALKNKNYTEVVNRNLGIVQVKTGDYKNAVASLEIAAKKFQQDFEVHFYKAEAHRGLKQYDEAIYHYNRADEISPNQIKVMKPLAWSYFQIRFYAKSLALGKKMLRLSKKDTQVYLILARTLVKTHRYNGALKVLNAAKKNAGKEDIALLKSIEGDVYLAEGKNEEAIRAYRIALKAQPLLGGALYGLGMCLIEDKQVDRGIKYLERAMRVKPEYAPTYLALGKAYEMKNEKKKYLSFYRRFIKLSIDDPEFSEKANELKGKFRAADK